MALKDNFLNEAKIGCFVDLMVGPKEISGQIISLDLDTVKLKKSDGKCPTISLDMIAYYEITDGAGNDLVPQVEAAPNSSVSKPTNEVAARQSDPVHQKQALEKLPFFVEVKYPKQGDFALDSFYKTNLMLSEKRAINRMYDSLKYRIRVHETADLDTPLNSMLNDVESTNEGISANAYRFILFLQARYGSTVSFDVMEKIAAHDFLAVYYHKHTGYYKAMFCACMALSETVDELFKDMLYTILAQGIEQTGDVSGLIRLIKVDPSILFEPNMQQLLKFIYATRGADYDSNSEAKTVLDYLMAYGQDNTVGRLIDIEKEKQRKAQEPEPEENMDSSEKEELSAVTRYGVIYQLSWATGKGKIKADNDYFEFAYSGISDKTLLAQVEYNYTTVLAEKDYIPVVFTVQKGRVFDVKQDIRKKTAYIEKTENLDLSPNLSNLRKARMILAIHTDPNRFEKALPYLESAIKEEDDPIIPLNDYFNVLLAVANKEDNVSCLQRGYDMYLKYKGSYNAKIGIINVPVHDLCTRFGKNEEALEALNRILSDPKISTEIRLTYILAKARILFEAAESLYSEEGASEEKVRAAYDAARLSYVDWEQRFSSTPSLRVKTNYNQIYHHSVLTNMAQCLIKLGNISQAKALLKKVLAYDPTNDNAKKLYTQLDSLEDTERRQDDAENEHAEQNDADFIDDGSDEEEYSPTEYEDVSGWKALNLSESDVLNYTLNLLANKRTAVAVTYLKAAALLNDSFKIPYNTLSYAVNNPMEDLNYRQENVVMQFYDSDDRISTFIKYAQIAAVLRGTFYHTGQQDYFVASAYLDKSILADFPALNKVITVAESFRTSTGTGMDCYADYRYKDSAKDQSISKAAEELYERYFGRLFHENVAQKRFKITKNIVFKKGSLIEQLLLCVKSNDFAHFHELSTELTDKFIRNDTVLSPDNIDTYKIEAFIDDAWRQAGQDDSIHERRSSTLMGSLRNNIRIPLRGIIELICEWAVVNQANTSGNSEFNLACYRSMRSEMLSNLNVAALELADYGSGADIQKAAGIEILIELVKELTARIDGSRKEEERKYYFSDFLRTNHILLNEANIPDLTFTFCDLPTFNILSRIRAHVDANNADIIGHARDIFTRDADKHDFGTAEKISEYLEFAGRGTEWSLPDDAEIFDEQAKKQLTDSYDKFNIDMASAVSRGQINPSNNFLRTIEETAQSLYQACVSSRNYGFFVRFVDLCTDMIHASALEYEAVLEAQLENLAQNRDMDHETYNKIREYISEQMFTVAEELMNRFSKGVLIKGDLPERGALDYLDKFWDEFEDNYNALARLKGSALAPVLSKDKARKDSRGGLSLINNWPKNSNCSEEQISTFLGLLGWQDIEVTKSDNLPNVTGFLVKQSGKVFSLREYPHPIAAFGSEAVNDGFYVVCLFGTTDSRRILDICKRLDSINGNKIILIDFVLTAGERRRLAKLMKQSNFAYTYLFVDRISLLFLANHFVGGIGESNNRALFAVSMPFTYYQPYRTGSSSTTAPELFSGRQDELRSVEDPYGANIIYGGRQLGKTAILKKAEQETHDPENGRYAFWIDIKERKCSESALKVSRILSSNGIFTEDQITDDWDKFAFNLGRSIKEKSISYVLLMLDEADAFIEDCKQYGFAPFVALKDLQLSTNGKFKFVLAGLHNLVKFKRDVSLGNNSVIAHLSFINVKPFDEQTARTLLREPLGYLGFDFEDDETAFMQIGSATNYYPGLIQLFCHKLINGLKQNYAGYSEADTPEYKIESKHISRVLADKDFLAEIKNKFEITLRLGEGNYYYLLALLLGMLYEEHESVDGYNVKDILDMADSIGIDEFRKMPKEETNALLDELCDLNILKMMGNGYAFRTKSFRDLLGAKDEMFEQLFDLLA